MTDPPALSTKLRLIEIVPRAPCNSDKTGIVEDTPVTLFIGEDEQRPLAERVARFLPKVCGNYTIIDTKEFELKGISEEYRGSISHHVMRAVNARVDAYMELFLRHPLSVRRYYRQFDY